jgi:hypothetical protein
VNSETLLIGLLNADDAIQQDGIEAFPEIPEDRPPRFLTVERTGGQRTPLMDYPTWAVQCWGSDREDASTLADLVADRIATGLVLDGRVASLDVTSSYNFPDPDSGQARYQLVVTGVLMTS